MLFRIATLKHYENLGKIKGDNVVILEGNREAWVEIDKVKMSFCQLSMISLNLGLVLKN